MYFISKSIIQAYKGEDMQTQTIKDPMTNKYGKINFEIF